MTCPQPQQLQQLLDESLPAEQQLTIQAHLEACAACQKTLEKLAAGGVTWDKTAQNLGEKPAREETALIAAVEKLHDTPTSAIQTQAESVSQSVDEDLSFLQPSTKPNSLGRLDEYEILSVIGKGGFGIVLKAFDESLHRVVAIKVMLPHLASNGTARDRFIREAKAAAAVMHENVVTIHVVEKKAKIPYLVMQFVSGVTLNEKIDKGGPLGLKEILRIGMQIAEGLAAAAKLGLVHRDIKPANILLENGVERVKITDFGLARTTDDASVSQLGTVAGTPMYMSPEQANGEQVDQRSDLFSLGSVLYVMCTGRPPFRATSTMAVMKRVCDEAATPVQQVNPDMTDWLGDIIAKLHAKRPADRFQSAKEVADLLGQHLAELQAGRAANVSDRMTAPVPVTVPAPPTPVVHAPGSPKRRRWALAATAFGMVAVVLIVGFATNFLGLAPWGAKHDTKKGIGPDGNPPFIPVFGGPDWRQLYDGKGYAGWQATGNSNAGRGEFLLFSGCNLDTTDKMPRNFHLRMEVNLVRGQGTLRFHAQPRVLQVDPSLPKDGWFLNFTENPQSMVNGELLARIPGQPNAINSAAYGASMAKCGEWAYLEVIAKGDYTDVLVNGYKYMTLKHQGNVPIAGVISLWNNGRGDSQIAFRKIEIKELPPTPLAKLPVLLAEKGVLDYAEIHDADEIRFDVWIAQMKKDGYRPVSLSVQTVKEAPRYTSIAIKEEAKKDWEFARVRSDDAKHIEIMRNRDYVAVAQCVFREKSYLYQAYLWVLDKNASMDWPSLGSKEDIDKKIAEAHKRKARLVYRSAFQGAAIVYDIIIGGPTNVSWADSVDQSLQDCKTWIDTQKAQRWRPEHLYAYGAGPNTLFGAITIQDPKGPEWDISWALTPAQYESELAARKRQGFRPHTAVGHGDDAGALRFSVIWIRYFDSAAKAAPVPP